MAHAPNSNGIAKHSTRAPAPRARAAQALPMDAVLTLGTRATNVVIVGVILALSVHAAAGVRAYLIPVEILRWAQAAHAQVHERLWAEVDIEQVKPPEPPPEEPVKEETPPPPPPPKAAAAPKEEPKEEETPPPPPEAAKAAEVLAQEPKAEEPVDMTNTFVTGTSNTYAGGNTERGGTSDTAVRNANARAGGVPGGTGTALVPAPPVPTVDRSRGAARASSGDWNCPWPAEADAAQMDEAAVLLRVTVKADGTVGNVEVLQDPGYGFGREAKRCALYDKWVPALDREGNPILAQTKTLRIRFDR